MLQRYAPVLSAAGLAMTVACSQSDSGITTAVKTKLADDVIVKESEINVDTGRNVVTLNGTVDIPAAKERAEIVARDTKGVVDVINDIVVDREVAATTGTVEPKADAARYDISEKAQDSAGAVRDTATDAAITFEVKAKFLAEPGVSGLKINVDTNDGVVTLSGNVKSMAEADKAIAVARQSSGVRRVVNHMRVD
jgi:hyperosmotically inducible protein